MIKSYTPLLIVIGLLFLNSVALHAQTYPGFSIELSTAIGYSNFLLNANDRYTATWNHSGISSKTKSRLAYQIGLGVAKPLNERIDLRLNFQATGGHFQYHVEGLIFASDIISSFEEEKASTLKARYQYWNLEIPVLADFYLSTQPNAYALSIGAGIAKNLSAKGELMLFYSDGREGEFGSPDYRTKKFNGFALLGFGKKIPIQDSNRNIFVRINVKYYFLTEELSLFDSTGHPLNINFQLAYRF